MIVLHRDGSTWTATVDLDGMRVVVGPWTFPVLLEHLGAALDAVTSRGPLDVAGRAARVRRLLDALAGTEARQ